jgi:hypothetical protein
MSCVIFSDADLARLLVGLAVLLVAAHGVGGLFVRFGQPAAIGEIVGGVLLGSSLFAAVFPTRCGNPFTAPRCSGAQAHANIRKRSEALPHVRPTFLTDATPP